jgi:hypothetical protein
MNPQTSFRFTGGRVGAGEPAFSAPLEGSGPAPEAKI